MGALGPFFHTLDAAQIRIPLQMLAILGAAINLYVIGRGNSRRQQLDANELTVFEKRKVNLVFALSILSLLAVAYEIYVHIFVSGMSYFGPTL